MPKGQKGPASQKENSASPETAPQRGRPKEAARKAEVRELAELALEAVRKGRHDTCDKAEQLLSGPNWPGIQQIREVAQRVAGYEGLSAWQALMYLMGSIIDDEIALLESWNSMSAIDSANRDRNERELVFLRRYLVEGVTLLALEPAFKCEKSKISRSIKQHLYNRLIDRAINLLTAGTIHSPHIASRIRNDSVLPERTTYRRVN